jgi:gamma-glutamyltranspeptidase
VSEQKVSVSTQNLIGNGLTRIAMYHSGIGGGGIALVRGINGSYEMIDFRETAPKAATQNMYDGNYRGSLVGGLARLVELEDN